MSESNFAKKIFEGLGYCVGRSTSSFWNFLAKTIGQFGKTVDGESGQRAQRFLVPNLQVTPQVITSRCRPRYRWRHHRR
jgi:hypothetical protein